MKLENLHVAWSVWSPARSTVDFAASVKTNAFVDTSLALAVDISATLVYVPTASLILAAFPVPPVHDGAFHDMSELAHVTEPPDGGVKLAAFGAISILSFFPSLRTIEVALTVWLAEFVLAETLFTVKVTDAGTVTFACSATVAVKVVVWDVSGNVTTAAHNPLFTSIMLKITATFLMFITLPSLVGLIYGPSFWSLGLSDWLHGLPLSGY
ncbi:MAG: hypothetical protein QHH26_06470 [Armatimonadota bacterium]|nr:hypothetical protein [Armatimonadota bacterium]